MTDDESFAPTDRPGTIAEKLMAQAEARPEVLARLVERWARAPTWTRREGIALAFMLDPHRIYDEDRYREGDPLPKIAEHYVEMARRDPDRDMLRDKVRPAKFIAWAQRAGLAFHPDWLRAVGETTLRNAQPMTTSSAGTPDRNELVKSWAGSPYWTPVEGAALAHGLDPKKAMRTTAGGYGTSVDAPDAVLHLCTLAGRAVETGHIPEQSTPLEFMEWARSIGTEFPPDWWSAAEAIAKRRGGMSGATAEVASTPELGTREQESLLKLVAGMAMAFYGWDRTKLRSDVAPTIADDLQRRGITMHADTIRKWIRRGADLVDDPQR